MIREQLISWLADRGVSDELAPWIVAVALAICVIALAIFVNWIAKRIIVATVVRLVRRTATDWDDVLVERKVFVRLSHLAPAVVFQLTAPLFPTVEALIVNASIVYMLVAGMYAVFAFLDAATDIYQKLDIHKNRPIKGYIQVAKILIVIGVAIVAIGILLERDPWSLLAGLGAATAVLLLVFRDTILSLVASVQISANDMVRLGDWIEVPRYGADGDVVDISLHTVTVQNWDKTLTTVPTYSLFSDSFKNWRGMEASGGRRIKRAIHIDQSTIRFATSDEITRWQKYQLLTPYLSERVALVEQWNRDHNVDDSELINGRRITNIGTFRAYCVAYLKAHPMVHQKMTFLVRQLKPTAEGLPIEIYVFSKDQAWANYESIQADIFDHLLAILPSFDLKVYQYPSGSDFQPRPTAG